MPQSLSDLSVHIIFSTRHREPSIAADLQTTLYEYVGGIARREGCRLMAAGGMADHVHLLVSLSREMAVADLLRVVKANSSKWIHALGDEARSFAWQAGYAAFSVSRSNVAAVTRYIQTQEEHHRRATFQEELVAFLKRHGVEYDERYIWE